MSEANGSAGEKPPPEGGGREDLAGGVGVEVGQGVDDGGLVEEALAGVGEEDEASATVALAGAAGDKVA